MTVVEFEQWVKYWKDINLRVMPVRNSMLEWNRIPRKLRFEIYQLAGRVHLLYDQQGKLVSKVAM